MLYPSILPSMSSSSVVVGRGILSYSSYSSLSYSSPLTRLLSLSPASRIIPRHYTPTKSYSQISHRLHFSSFNTPINTLSSFRSTHAFPRSHITQFQQTPTRHQTTSQQPSPPPRHNPYQNPNQQQNHHIAAWYVGTVIMLFCGLAYGAVPMYKIICSDSGLDGTPMVAKNNHQGVGGSTPDKPLKPVPGAKKIRITFNADTSDSMRWKFSPQTKELWVVPGETALAFYSAYNPTNEDIIGISTYSVVPAKTAQYFNKIQCFCFEEQKLLAGEEVDMPVFFYLDPEFAFDPYMKDVDTITLSYTFFKSKGDGRLYKV